MFKPFGLVFKSKKKGEVFRNLSDMGLVRDATLFQWFDDMEEVFKWVQSVPPSMGSEARMEIFNQLKCKTYLVWRGLHFGLLENARPAEHFLNYDHQWEASAVSLDTGKMHLVLWTNTRSLMEKIKVAQLEVQKNGTADWSFMEDTSEAADWEHPLDVIPT